MKAPSGGSAAALIGLCAALAPAGGQAQPSYPAAVDREAVAGWLPHATGLAPEQVVALSPSAATTIVSRTQAPGGRVEILLRALALTPEATARSGVLAWQAPVQLDCRTGEVRLGATVGFGSWTGDKDAIALAPAEEAWRRPKPDTPLASAWRAVCAPGFQPPLIAQAATPPRAGGRTPSATTFARNATVRASMSPATSSGSGSVQVVSSPRAADTRQALAVLQGRFAAAMQGLQTHLEPAQVRGRTFYRGVVAGFASREQAQAFCETLRRGGQDCLAR